jgi:hypothetical protein
VISVCYDWQVCGLPGSKPGYIVNLENIFAPSQMTQTAPELKAPTLLGCIENDRLESTRK